MQIVSRLSPFSSKVDERFYPAGMSITEILDFVGVGKRLRKCCNVTISGHEIDSSNWKKVRPKEGTIVKIVATPQGGGGGGKGVLGIVMVIAAIAISVFAPYLAPTLALTFSSTATIGSGVAFAGAVATFTTALGYAASALALVGMAMISASAQKKLGSSSGASATSNTLKITGTSNQSNKWGVVPRVYGRHKVFPLVCANSYTEVAGDDEYLRMLLTFGYGPITISDLKIGTNPIDWYDDVEYEFRSGTPDDEPLTLYTNSVLQDSYSVVLEKDVTRTFRSRINANELSFDLYFQSGLCNFDKTTGNPTSRTALFKMEYRKVDDTDWTIIQGNSSFCTEYSYSEVPIYDWVGGVGDGAPDTYQLVGYETVATCISSVSVKSITDSTTSSFSVSTRVVVPTPGQYDVRVTRLTDASSDTSALDTALFTVFRTFVYENPVTMQNVSLLALRIKATDQLNGVISELNAIAYGECKTLNEEGELQNYTHTRNNAWAYLDALIGPGCKNPVALNRIDTDKIYQWSLTCDELDSDGNPMYQFDAVIDSATTTFELLNNISTAARGSFGTRAGKFGLVLDEPQTIIRDIYTPRNTFNFKGYKTLYEKPHAVRARFVNPDLDWAQDEITVYATGYNSSNAERFEEVEWFGVVTYSQVYRLTAYYLAAILLRPEKYTVGVSLDGFVVERGDLVSLAHDVPLVGGTPALIKNVTLDGDYITHIFLDDFVTMEVDGVYGLKVRDLEGNVSTYSVVTVPGETKVVELSPHILKSDVSKSQSIAVFGKYSDETVQALVSQIERDANLTAKLTLIPYNDAIYTADTQPIPPYNPNINNTEAAVPGIVQSLSFAESISGGGAYTVVDVLSWTSPENVQSVMYEVYRWQRGSYRLQTITSSKEYIFSSGVIGTSESFAVIAVSPSGRKLPVSQAATIEFVVGAAATPNVTAFDGDIVGTNIVLSWECEDTYVQQYIIKHTPEIIGADWSSSVIIASVSAPTKVITLPAQTGTYLIKAQDYYKNESQVALSTINNVSALSELNVVEVLTESPDFSGIKENVVPYLLGIRIGDEEKTVDDIVNFDYTTDFDSTDAQIVSSGTYYFANSCDLGDVYTSRLTSTISAYGISFDSLFDSVVNVDLLGSFDGDTQTEYNVELFLRTTNDDPLDSPTWSEWKQFTIGEYTARAFEFKLVLSSLADGVSPVVTYLSVTIDMPERFEKFKNLQSGTSSFHVTYSYPFKENPVIGITSGNMNTGDYPLIENETNEGFDITFFNTSAVIVNRRFDVLSVGYGRAN